MMCLTMNKHIGKRQGNNLNNLMGVHGIDGMD